MPLIAEEVVDLKALRARSSINDLYLRLRTTRRATVVGDRAGPIMAAEFHPENQSLLLATESGQILLAYYNSIDGHRIASEEPQTLLQLYPDAIFDIQWKKNIGGGVEGYAAAVGDNHIYIHHSSGETLQCLGYHDFNIRSIRFQPDNPHMLASAGRDGDIALWDLRNCDRNSLSNQPVGVIHKAHGSGKKGNSSVTALQFFPGDNQHLLASVGQPDYSIRIWDLRNTLSIANSRSKGSFPMFQIPAPISGRRARAFISLTTDSRGEYLFATSSDNHVYRYLSSNFSSHPVETYSAPSFRTSGCFYIRSCLSPDDKFLLCGGTDGQAYIWSVEGQKRWALALGEQRFEVSCVAWSSDCQFIFTGGDDIYSRIWRVYDEGSTVDENNYYSSQLISLPSLSQPSRKPQTIFSDNIEVFSSPNEYEWPTRMQPKMTPSRFKQVTSVIIGTPITSKRLKQSNLDCFLTPTSAVKRLNLDKENKPFDNI